MMLRVFGMLLALVLAMLLAASAHKPIAQKPIKVGVPSDPPALFGEPASKEALMFVEELKAKGIDADHPLTLSARPAPSFTIGPRTSIISAATLAALGSWFWQDSGIGILNNGDGTYAFFASVGGTGHSGAPGKMVGTMSNPLAVSALETVVSGTVDAPDAAVADIVYQGGGPIYKDPASGLLIIFTHNERRLNPSFGGTQFYSWLGILKSTDGGASWTDCGVIITPHHTFAEMLAAYDTFGKSDGTNYYADVGWGPYVIVGDYFYIYYIEWSMGRSPRPGSLRTPPVWPAPLSQMSSPRRRRGRSLHGRNTPGAPGRSPASAARVPRSSTTPATRSATTPIATATS
jgi:hypothetical protein